MGWASESLHMGFLCVRQGFSSLLREDVQTKISFSKDFFPVVCFAVVWVLSEYYGILPSDHCTATRTHQLCKLRSIRMRVVASSDNENRPNITIIYYFADLISSWHGCFADLVIVRRDSLFVISWLMHARFLVGTFAIVCACVALFTLNTKQCTIIKLLRRAIL